MKAPLTFAYRNVVFGQDTEDAWGLYRLATCAYVGLTTSRKREVLSALAGLAYSVEADFQLLRVSRSWSATDYRQSAVATADKRHAHAERFEVHLDLHELALGERHITQPEVYIAVRLGRVTSETTDRSIRQLAATARSAVGWRDARGISQRSLDLMLAQEDRVLARLLDFVDAERASTSQLQWLVRRGFMRGLGEPDVEEFWRPQALVIQGDEDDARRRYVPLQADMLRLTDSPINVAGRSLRIESESGDSHQALLAVGALPETVTFPGRQAELLFAPLEAVPFPVDAVFSARWIANDQALALARRKLIDADLAYTEELHGDHGPTASGADRPAAARELEDYLTSGQRPPLLRGSIGLCVGAPDREELERRVQRLRHEFMPVRLHRPLGAQLDLFLSHLPAQRSRVRAYEDVFSCEQLGAMVPQATHAVGSSVGTYIGQTLSGSAQPVLLDLTEGSRTSRPPAILCSGTLGSGKTLTALLLAYQAFLAGSRIVTVDPKGDHHLDRLVGAEHVERIELRPGEQDRGLLDPLRIAPDDTRADLAYSFLVDLLPAPVPPAWQTELRGAVDAAVAAGARSCGEVLATLDKGNEAAREVGRAIAVHSASGLLQLGFAERGDRQAEPAAKQVTCLHIANLTLPLPGTPRSELSSAERTGQALLRLLATYALRLMGSDWSRHKVLVFDEAWMLLGDATGRALVQRMNRLCRSQNATPILATQILADASDMENLIGALMCFGVETDREARHALELLHMDADDERLRSQLQGFRQGRCFMRDYEGRVAPVQIDPVDPAILDALDTRPASA